MGTSPATLQKFLKGADYPASKDDLIKLAENNGAPEEIMDLLASMPDVDFGGVQEVQECYSHILGDEDSQDSGRSSSQDSEDDFQKATREYEERKRKRQQEQQDDDDAHTQKWDRRLKGHETKALKDAREMKHGYDGRGRVTDPENDHRLKGNETPALKDAREMKHGYDGRGRVRKLGDEVDENIADDFERYEERQRAKEGEQSIDPETGSHSRRRKNDNGEIIRGTETFMEWKERLKNKKVGKSKKRQTWSEFFGQQ